MKQITDDKTPFAGLWTRRTADGIGPNQDYEWYRNPDLYENMVTLDELLASMSAAIAILGGGGQITSPLYVEGSSGYLGPSNGGVVAANAITPGTLLEGGTF